MADVNGPAPQPANGAPAPAAAGQPATFQVPDGYRMVKSDEYDGLSRMAEKGRGADSFYAKAKASGFEKAEDFEKWSPALKAIRDRKLEPDFISKAFGMNIPDESARDKPETPQFDPVKFKGELMSEWKRDHARGEWSSGHKSESALVSKAVELLAPESPVKGKTLELAVRQTLEELRGSLPDDHPLSKELPEYLTEKHVTRAVESLKKVWADEKAAQLAEKGDKVRASDRTVPTAAQPGTRQGQPSTDTNRGPRDRLKDSIDNARQKLNIGEYKSAG